MENLQKKIDSGCIDPEKKSGDNFYLIVDGQRVGPFLSLGRLDHLEKLLNLRGVRLSA